jgi:hypothetical protein
MVWLDYINRKMNKEIRSLFQFQNLNKPFSSISKSLPTNEGWPPFSGHKMHKSSFKLHACLSQGLAQFLHKPVVYLASCRLWFMVVADLNEFCVLNRMKTIGTTLCFWQDLQCRGIILINEGNELPGQHPEHIYTPQIPCRIIFASRIHVRYVL